MATGLRNKCILVIDDDIGMLRAVTKVLSAEGCVVAGASDAAVAAEFATDPHHRFDLVITDIRMPSMNGMEVLEIVKTKRPNIPVILITAFGGAKARAEAERLGAADYLEKPIDSFQLINAVAGVFKEQPK